MLEKGLPSCFLYKALLPNTKGPTPSSHERTHKIKNNRHC